MDKVTFVEINNMPKRTKDHMDGYFTITIH
jgi:hypothetical protein